MGSFKTFLARVCSVCPFCIARRRSPESAYGRIMRRVKKVCPFCRAYDAQAAEIRPGSPGKRP